MVRKRRLFWQLYPSYLLISLISLAAATWYASSAVRHFFLEQTASDLKARAQLFEKQVIPYLDPLDEKALDLASKDAGRHAETRVTVILPSGRVVGDSDEEPAAMDTHADRPEVLKAIKTGLGTSIRHSRTLKKDLMYVAIPVLQHSNILAVVRTSIPTSAVDHALKDIQTRIILGGMIMALFAAILGLLVSRRITRPIEKIRNWADSISEGEFLRKPSIRASDEIEALSESLGKMAGDLKERIEMVSRQRNEMEAVFSSMVEGVLALDTEERVIRINKAATRMLDCSLPEAKGRTMQEVSRNTVLHQFMQDTLSSGKPLEKDVLLSTSSRLMVNAHGTILHDSERNRIGALIVLNDVTRLRQLENIRREFVANVSHELKTPITAIKGFVETLRDGAAKDPLDRERFLEIIDKHVDRLEAIVENLLYLSRIEQGAGEGEMELVESRIAEILRTAAQVCNVRATAKKIEIKISCPEPITAAVSSPLLEQAVINLLDNAIKYSEKGKVVRVEAMKKNEETIVSVHDQGCGIEKKHLPRLFERFYRVDKARSRHLGGTGLGLAIVKHIVQAHGGRLTVASTPGKGSVFSIHLPAS